jgi:hypothetical protein
MQNLHRSLGLKCDAFAFIAWLVLLSLGGDVSPISRSIPTTDLKHHHVAVGILWCRLGLVVDIMCFSCVLLIGASRIGTINLEQPASFDKICLVVW